MRRLSAILVGLALGIAGVPLFLAFNTFSEVPMVVQGSSLTALIEHTSLKNGVTAIITSFRPLDTFACLLVLLGSIVAVLSLTMEEKAIFGQKRRAYQSIVLSTITTIYFTFAIMFGIYLLAYGFDFPGGGIQAGVMMTASSILFFLAFGHKQFEEKLYPGYFLVGSVSGIILFVIGGLELTLWPSLAIRAGIFPQELGLAISVGAILSGLFWVLAQEEEK